MNALNRSQAKKYSVTLLGRTYSFISDDPETTVHDSIDRVTQVVKTMGRQYEQGVTSDHIDESKVFLLTAITLAHELQEMVNSNELLLERLENVTNQGIASLIE